MPNATGITQSDAKPRVPRVAARENVGLYAKGSGSGSPRGEHQGDTAWPQAERLTHTPMTRACIGVAVAPPLVLRTTGVLCVRQVRGVRANVAFTARKGMSRRNPTTTLPPVIACTVTPASTPAVIHSMKSPLSEQARCAVASGAGFVDTPTIGHKEARMRGVLVLPQASRLCRRKGALCTEQQSSPSR